MWGQTPLRSVSPRQKFLDVAKAKEAGGAWATDYVIAIKGKIEKPRTSKRYGIVYCQSEIFRHGLSRQQARRPGQDACPCMEHGGLWSIPRTKHGRRDTTVDAYTHIDNTRASHLCV